MTAIYKKELKSCFHSVIGWLFIALTLFLIGLYVTAYNLAQGISYVNYALQSSIILFIIAVPILTMRVFSEERKYKTDQLILTAPVSVWKIVLGKFLAMETVFAVPCAFICLYPLLLNRYGEIPFAENYVSLLGFFLYGSAAIAIGIFISSLTESQVIAAVLSVVAVFVGYIMAGLCNLISTGGNLLTKLLSVYDLTTPFLDLTNGNLKLASVFYYVSVIFLFLFFTTQSIQKRRYSVSVKRLKRGAYSGLLIILTTALVICANFLLRKAPARYTEFDVTNEKLYSLTEESCRFMDSLQEDVTIYVLSSEANMNLDVVETLRRYADYSGHISVEYVDFNANPTFAAQYTDAEAAARSLIVTGEKRSRYIDYSELYVSELSYETYSYETTGYDAEGQITSALAYVTTDDMPKVYLLSGHGENVLETGFLSALEKLNVEYEDLNLLTADAVPKDARCLIINAPKADLSADDLVKIRSYLNNGGNGLFIYGYSEEALTNYASLLADYSVRLAEGMVVEQDRGHYYQNMLYLLPEIEYDEVTASLTDKNVFAPYAVGIIIDTAAEEAGEVRYLLKTTEDSFARVNPGENTSGEKTDGDIDGPFAIGAKVKKQVSGGESTAIIYTSGEMFQEAGDYIVYGSNKLLFQDAVGHFASVESSISIPVKNYQAGYLMVPALDFILIGLVIVIVIPLALLIAGVVIWLRRRKK